MFNRALEPGARFFVAPESIGPIDGEKFESIMVQRFRTVPPSDNTNFCYVREDGSWQMDQTNGWFTDPADMYCDVFASALEQSGRFRMVGLEGVSVRFDFRLEGVVESLYADYSDPEKPVAVVELRAYLFDRREARIRLIASVFGTGRSVVVGKTAPALADAFSIASHDALKATIEALPKQVPLAEVPAKPAETNAAN